jgi:glycosyltransferase involved in cell wall biosynthesis
MRVIHITHGKVNPTGHNGISRVVYHLNKQERLQGIDSEIWALVDGTRSHYSYKRDEFVTVECFPRVRLPFGRHEIVDRLLAEKDSIDIVHFHLIWFFDKNIIASALAGAGIPFIITTHGTYSKPHAYTGKRLLAKWLFELKYLRRATEIHTITREEGTALQKYGYKGRSFVAYNGIDPDEIPQERSRDFFIATPFRDKLKLIWIGVLREDKNLLSLIEAVSLLPSDLRDQFVCVLVGPDWNGNAEQYAAFADKLRCTNNFHFVGPLYGQDKYDALESADAYVMPSYSEVFSLAMLDAMACAKPCLATSGCGYNYFIGDNFFVACEPYAQDIAVGLQELFDRREEWPIMGANGRTVVDRDLNWKGIAKVMIDNYSRILRGAT